MKNPKSPSRNTGKMRNSGRQAPIRMDASKMTGSKSRSRFDTKDEISLGDWEHQVSGQSFKRAKKQKQ